MAYTLTMLTILAISASRDPCETFGVSLAPASKATLFFSGETVSMPLVLSGGGDWKGTLVWTLTMKERVVTGGTISIKADTPRQTLSIPMETPPITKPIILDGRFRASLRDMQGHDVASIVQTVHFSGRDLLAGRKEWARQLNVAVFDPHRETSKRLGEWMPHHVVLATSEDIRSRGGGTLIVGENTSFKSLPGLAKELCDAAARGVRVICLAPADGTWPLPHKTVSGTSASVHSITLHNEDSLGNLDLVLEGNVLLSKRFVLEYRKNKACLTVLKEGEGWAWAEVKYPSQSGRLIFCGFNVIGAWDSGPGPRILLIRLLEHSYSSEKKP